jgi:hypothetical protein
MRFQTFSRGRNRILSQTLRIGTPKPRALIASVGGKLALETLELGKQELLLQARLQGMARPFLLLLLVVMSIQKCSGVQDLSPQILQSAVLPVTLVQIRDEY